MSPIETLIAALKQQSHWSWWRDDERDGFVSADVIDGLIEAYESATRLENPVTQPPSASGSTQSGDAGPG